MRGSAKGQQAEVALNERRQPQHPMRAGKGRQEEAVQPILDRARNELREGPGITAVGPAERSQVLRAVPPVDHGGRVASAHEEQVDGEATCTSEAIAERMDLLEASMERSQVLHQVLSRAGCRIRVPDPVAHERLDVGACWWLHPASKGADVVQAR